MSEYEEDRRIEGAHITEKPAREKYIPAELARLEKYVASLQERLADLTTRLDPILSAKGAQGQAENAEARQAIEKSMPPLAASLHQQNDRLFSALARVDYLIQSLEL